MAARLAERYAKCREPLVSLSLHYKHSSARKRGNHSHYKLPRLDQNKSGGEQEPNEANQDQ